MDGLFLIGLLIVVYALVAPALGIEAALRARRLEREVRALTNTVGQLRDEVWEATQAATPKSPVPEEEPRPATPPVEPSVQEAQSSAATASERDEAASTAPAEQEASNAVEAPPPSSPPHAPRPALEERLTANWLVWLGGVTLAVGGFFFVRYLMDRDLLGPLARILLGLVFGVALVVAGEWLRRRPLERSLAAIKPTQIPAALSGAGVFTMFVTGYLAFQLYGLITPILTFALLAGIAALAVLLSLLQGPFLAVLGLLGGYITPALIPSDSPSAIILFTYIFILSAGGIAVVRYQVWWWLAGLVLTGAAAWPLLWMASPRLADETALAAYLNAAFLLFVLVRPPLFDIRESVLPRMYDIGRLPMPERVAVIAGLTFAVLMFVLVRVDAYGPASLAALIVFCAAALVLARREALLDLLALAAASAALAAFATWHLPKVLTDQQTLVLRQGREVGIQVLPIVPPEVAPFALIGTLLTLLFCIGGFIAFWGARRPQLWAGLSASVPVLLLVIAFWRVLDFSVDFAWAGVAVALAVLFLFACERLVRYRSKPGVDAALGIYASGVTAALSWAFAMSLEQAWLSTALALQLPAMALIERRLRTGTLRYTALVLAAIVLVRLIINPNIIDYDLGNAIGSQWVIYGYGLPAVSFFVAARLFGKADRPDLLTGVLQAGALAFATLLVTFELRILMAGSIESPDASFAEVVTQALAWGVIGLVLYGRSEFDSNWVVRGGAIILTSFFTLNVLALQLFDVNPLLTGEPVGSIPVLNLILLAYGGAAILGFLFARQAQRRRHPRMAQGSAAFCLIMVFVTLSLQVRHLFHGTDLTFGPTGSGEWYTYSAVWLAYAGALLWIGIDRQAVALRHASLALVMLTVGKVFLFDMSELTGIWRPLSFLGLGLTLIAVAYAYRRFVFPLQKPATEEPASA